MILLISSFLAGILTVLAPCVIIFVPVILSRSIDSKRKPWLVLISLALSVIIFSIILKSTTLLINVPQSFWSVASGVIVLFFGLVTLWPKLWEDISLRFGYMLKAQKQLSDASSRNGAIGDIMVGASLGPIFSACSPTYALIVATILPATPLQGLVYLLAYVAGLMTVLTLIAIFGRKLIQKLRWGINPKSVFNKILGTILIIVGTAIILGLDKTVLSSLVESGAFDWQLNLERLLQDS